MWSNLGLCFHFIPGDPKDLICRVDSELSRRIMMQFKVYRCVTPFAFCKLGIALHGLQDTYSHQGWVGKFSKHNVLPAWSHDKFTPSLPFPYGHSPMGKTPDVANAIWYDPRTNAIVTNVHRTVIALQRTAAVLGLGELPLKIRSVFTNTLPSFGYTARKQALPRRKRGGASNAFAPVPGERNNTETELQ